MQVYFHINTAAYVLYIFVGISGIIAWLGYTGFLANVVQFGMDQLHDSPGEDRTLFIHWYAWAPNGSFLLVQIAWDMVIQPYHIHNNYSIIGYCLVVLIPVVAVIVLALTLCLARQRRRWFLIEPGRLNPYKLIYRVTKFARQHKVPVQRSAFTYCEEELPSGLDLGKEKYGGCFTTEQVEDVKAFYGILKVLLSFGIVSFLLVPAGTFFSVFSLHITPDSDENYTTTNTFAEQLIFSNGLFSSLLTFICIPLYLCLLRPFISQYVPGMLKRMGLGIVFVLLSLVALLSMDTAVHLNVDQPRNETVCMFDVDYSHTVHSLSLSQNPAFLIFPLTLNSLGSMFYQIAIFEFICSQSPHSMTGSLIGMSFAIQGFYQVLAIAAVFGLSFDGFYPSCGIYYYLTNIVIGVIALLVCMCVAKRYQYRKRDDLCNIHQYAENYYSNYQQEQYYDYD